MLSNEEMKAIEKIRSFNQYNWEMNNLKEKEFAKPYFDALDTILNLIKKQSKEIEHQKEKRANQKKELAILNAKQIEFNKLVNTVNSYKGQFKRQEKEIEELKDMNERQKYRIELVSEDKIEERGDSIDESTMLKQIKNKLDKKNIPIETLLAEFERLEDLEDRKVQIEYNNVFNKGVKSVKDKIKAKIEVLEKLQKEFPNNDEIRIKIIAYKELLEKE